MNEELFADTVVDISENYHRDLHFESGTMVVLQEKLNSYFLALY